MAISLRGEEVVAIVDEQWGRPCTGCSRGLLGQEVVISLLMGFRGVPRCVDCLAQGTGRERPVFLREARARVRPLDCYRVGWEHADRRMSSGAAFPAAELPADLRLDGRTVRAPAAPEVPAESGVPEHHSDLDAGDMSCGDLALRLRVEFTKLDAGTVVRVTALDVAAPQDLPAWCELTGHRLLHMEHPQYWIERRSDP